MNAKISETIRSRMLGLTCRFLGFLCSACLFQQGATLTIISTNDYSTKTTYNQIIINILHFNLLPYMIIENKV